MRRAQRHRNRTPFRVVALLFATVTAVGLIPNVSDDEAAAASPNDITVDANAEIGMIQPTVVGQMMEWALPNMNEAWAERLENRSFERGTVATGQSPLYDAFDGSGLDRSLWTPMSLDTVAAGTITVNNSELAITAAADGRFGVMSNNIADTDRHGYSVEARIVDYNDTNVILSVYGGAGAGDFDDYVEFAIEGNELKVYADGQSAWAGGTTVTAPATLRIDISPPEPTGSGIQRDIAFFHNGTQVHTISNFTQLPGPYRVFLYGWDGTVKYDWVTINRDATFDAFDGTQLASRWTPTRLAGSTNGSTSVSSGALTITGGTGSRYGVLSEHIPNSSTDWTRVSARLTGQTGTNALINIYGGSGAGDYSSSMEFGIEGGVAKIYSSSGVGNWVGSSVSLPATLDVLVSPSYANGRQFQFFVNGTKVHSLSDHQDVPPDDYRVFLYGYGTSTTTWDHLDISQTHMWDGFAPHFEGGPGLSVEWTPTTLAGTWGSASQANSQLTVTGATNSRYGVISPPLDESDIYDYTIEAKLDSYTGTNGLVNIYAGTGRGDFSKFIEFGIENGTLRVYGDGITSWTGPSAVTPAVLRIDVSRHNGTTRDFYFYYNDSLVHTLENVTVIPNQDYQVFLYGWSTSVTTWDYLTWWRQPAWTEDGHANRAEYSHDRGGAYNGSWSQTVDITANDEGGRKGVSQTGIPVVSGNDYEVILHLKQDSLTDDVIVALGPAAGEGPGYTAYASAELTSVGATWNEYTVNLISSTTDTNAKLFIGTQGTGTLSIDMASVMPQDSDEVVHGGWDKKWVDRVVTLDPQVIRWPGGILADWYDWEDGVGNRDQRPPQYFAQWNALVMTNDVGTHEILNLGEALGIDVVLNVNWGTGTKTEAADWVEYVTGSTGTTQGSIRNTNGRSSPWNVSTWEIGNEVWGWWVPGYEPDDQVFADSYVEFRDAMHAKNASLIYIGEGGDGNSSDQTWNTTMIQTADGKIDHLATHYYGPQSLPQDYSDTDVYRAAVGSPATVQTRLDASRGVILAESNEDIKLAITEYNAMYFNNETRRTRSLEAALQVAGFINMFARNSDLIEVNFYSTLMNFWDGGGIRLGSRGSFVTPSYEVLRLFGLHHGDVLVGSSVESPTTFNAPAMGNLPARTGIPHLDVTSTKSTDGTKLYVSVVNRHDTTDITSTVTIANGGTIASTGTAWVLDSANYLDSNSWTGQTDVIAASSTITGVGSSFSHAFPAHSYTILEITLSADAVTTPTLIGQVTDVAGAAISGATVQITGAGSTTTDVNGYFQLATTVGTKELTASATGYVSSTLTGVDVHGSGNTSLPFRLVVS